MAIESRSGNRLAPGLTLLASALAEQTTQSGTTADVVQLAGLNVPAAAPLLLTFSARKTAAAAATASLGLRYNAVQVLDNFAVFSAADQAENGGFQLWLPPGAASYGRGTFRGNRLGDIVDAGFTAERPAAALTALTITGLVGDVLVTLGVSQVRLYAFTL
jgi:hypothetical protein